jgi:hypothetical protein
VSPFSLFRFVLDPPMSACCRPWAPWAVEHMHLWASSVGHMLGPACNATRLAATGAPLMLMTYEALRADTPTTLARVLQFVGTCGRRAGRWSTDPMCFACAPSGGRQLPARTTASWLAAVRPWCGVALCSPMLHTPPRPREHWDLISLVTLNPLA